VRRRKAAPRWLRPARNAAIVLSLCAVVIGGPVWLWQSGLIAAAATSVRDAAIARTASAGLTVQNVLLDGRRNTPHRAVRRAVRLKRGDAILGVDIDAIRQRLKAIAWVREATVVRRLPDTIAIQIVERQPFALWQRKRKLVLVDELGEVITTRRLGAFRKLPILVGGDAPRHAPSLFAMLKSEPRLARQVISAVRVGKRRWNVEFRNGIQVRLPENDPHVAWRRLARLDARHRLLARDVRMIDMRLPDRLILRPGALGAQAIGGKGRRT
jgi:cell division protein FtsQ